MLDPLVKIRYNPNCRYIKPMADQGLNIEIFLTVLRQILPSLHNQPDAQLVRRIGKEKLEDASADVAGFIEHGTTSNLTKNERLALTRQVLDCLTQHMKNEMNMPITLNTIISSMQLIEHATAQSFPGYAEAKLLRYLIVPLQRQPEIIPVRN